MAIGAELIGKPGVLLLDEPTTGLDSSNATTVVGIMTDLAESNTAVLASIHQPRPDMLQVRPNSRAMQACLETGSEFKS